MMLFVPWSSSFKIGIDADAHAVRQTLNANVSGKIFSLFPRKPFIGFVNNAGFDIEEPSWFARLHVPKFRGSFHETNNGLIVHVRVSNGSATLTVVMGWLIAASLLGMAFHRLLNGEYALALISTVATFGSAACTFFTGRFYYRKLNDGKQKLISILQWEEKRGRP